MTQKARLSHWCEELNTNTGKQTEHYQLDSGRWPLNKHRMAGQRWGHVVMFAGEYMGKLQGPAPAVQEAPASLSEAVTAQGKTA